MPPKTVLITGCGVGGIGTALAKAFHQRGHRVFATSRSERSLDPGLKESGIHTLVLDVTNEESINSVVATVSELTDGKLDLLINNAGVLQCLPFADTPVADAKRIFDVNVIGFWAISHAFLPLLIKAQGTLAALGSINEVMCPPFVAGYTGSKAAVEAILRTIRRELAPLGVRVVILKTGAVKTRLFGNAAPTVLPEGSFYAPIREWIERRKFLDMSPEMDVDKYAKAVANELLRDNPKAMVWKGSLVFIIWVLSWFGWETMLDYTLIKGNHLDKCSPKLSSS